MNNKIGSGSEVLDSILDGGLEKDVVTTIYGPSGSGKTNFCITAITNIAKTGKKVLFLDTEGGFSVERMKQISEEYTDFFQNIIFFKPTSFSEQKDAFEKLKEIVDEKVGLIVIDSIAMLYRLELGKSDDIYNVNRELGQQIAYLTEISRKKDIPVLITNQVYSNFDDKTRLNMVGGDILKYGSKCLIELTLNEVTRKRKAVLKKHRYLPEDIESEFEIKEKGVFRV
tara:strand:+ start:974 stop:1654 length:681 start_codon:yes stop_codon:yes gene_type:complete